MNVVQAIKAAFDSLYRDKASIREERSTLSSNIASLSERRHTVEVLWQEMIAEREKLGNRNVD